MPTRLMARWPIWLSSKASFTTVSTWTGRVRLANHASQLSEPFGQGHDRKNVRFRTKFDDRACIRLRKPAADKVEKLNLGSNWLPCVAWKPIEYLLKHFITVAESIPYLRCRLNSTTMHSIWQRYMNVISYFDTWHVAPYFVRGSSVLMVEPQAS